jgi:enolase
MNSTAIRAIHARQILDSRGRPTVEVDVVLSNDSCGRASVPSGASTGAAEAHELRDGDLSRYEGLGVLQAVANVNGEIARALTGHDALDQAGLDRRLRELDGTDQLQRLGANGILGVSMAACRAAAVAKGQALYQRIAELAGNKTLSMPLPMVNILSGGLHAGRGMDVQDFLAMPLRATSIAEAIHVMARVRSKANEVAKKRGLSTLLADEGGLSPACGTGTEALEMMIEIFECAGLVPGTDVGIAIDVAASSLKGPDGTYRLAREGRDCTSAEMIDLMESWVRNFPVVSIEDALDEEDWSGWKTLSTRLADKVQLVGDDLFTTNSQRVNRGISAGIANGVLVKFNQNGTLSGTLEVIANAKLHNYAPVISARSGETEDAFMSDLAVGTAAGQIKIGSLRTSSTVAKYNQLLRIEEASGAAFAGVTALAGRNK